MNIWKEKIRFKVKHILPGLFARLNGLEIRLERVVLVICLFLIGGLLVSNIYASLTKGVESYNILSQEMEILNSMRAENEKLKSDYDYYESNFYRELYARESLNYVRDGQKLFKVERRPDYAYEEPNTDPIMLENKRFWWVWLIS